MSSKFAYVSYIRSTPEKVWEALTMPEFTKQYWFGMEQDCDWTVGAKWQLRGENGVMDSGHIVEIDKPRRMVISWHHQKVPEFHADGATLCTIELEAKDDQVKLSILHECEKDNSKVIGAVGGGWPQVISSLKSLLETGMAMHR